MNKTRRHFVLKQMKKCMTSGACRLLGTTIGTNFVAFPGTPSRQHKCNLMPNDLQFAQNFRRTEVVETGRDHSPYQRISQSMRALGYGMTNTAPVVAPAWKAAPRQLSGIGSNMYGAQLPGR